MCFLGNDVGALCREGPSGVFHILGDVSSLTSCVEPAARHHTWIRHGGLCLPRIWCDSWRWHPPGCAQLPRVLVTGLLSCLPHLDTRTRAVWAHVIFLHLGSPETVGTRNPLPTCVSASHLAWPLVLLPSTVAHGIGFQTLRHLSFVLPSLLFTAFARH